MPGGKRSARRSLTAEAEARDRRSLFTCGAAHHPRSFTYWKLPGLPSMPARGGAIHGANAPGSVTGRIRLAT